MILDSPVPEAANASLQRIKVPNLNAIPAKGRMIASPTDFLNAAGTMQVEVQVLAAMPQPEHTCASNTIVNVLDGSLTLNDGEAAHIFGEGETACVHQGDQIGWSTADGTRMIIASYTDRS